jgi:hypothetical protein
MVVKKLDNRSRCPVCRPDVARNRGQIVNAMHCLNVQMPKMSHTAVLGTTIQSRALHNHSPGK